MCAGYATPLMWYGGYHTSTFPFHLELNIYACIIELMRAKAMSFFGGEIFQQTSHSPNQKRIRYDSVTHLNYFELRL
jgi:hypothetical protein